MLINCPECDHQISDKASVCLFCGFPIALPVKSSSPERKSSKNTSSTPRKYRRLPNGYGCISKASGKRRRPYAAIPPVTGYKLNGSPVRPCAIGYFETYQDAYAALIDWKNHPERNTNRSTLTFEDVYDRWWKDKFEDPASKIVYSDSTKKNYKWAYGKCSSLYQKPMCEIFKDDMQILIDTLQLSYSSARNMMNLFSSMFDYAYKNGIVDKNYAEFLSIKQGRLSEKGVPFTSEEIAILWQNVKNTNVRITLILIYSGMRLSELKTVTIDLEKRVFVGGVKTAAGRNRTIPIHSKILPLVEDFDQYSFSTGNFRDKLFPKTLSALGFPNAETGEKHTPHDCRHTFSWLCDKYKMDDLAKHLIIGHSLGSDVDRNTYGHRTVDELKAEMEKITE